LKVDEEEEDEERSSREKIYPFIASNQKTSFSTEADNDCPGEK
jgi:hypothetical protein